MFKEIIIKISPNLIKNLNTQTQEFRKRGIRNMKQTTSRNITIFKGAREKDMLYMEEQR